jgi:hypothetical protein
MAASSPLSSSSSSSILSLCAMKLECPVCHELPFDALVGKCGHSVCLLCHTKWKEESRQEKCPICRVQSTYMPNYMIRNFLDQPPFKEEMTRLKKVYYLTTPEGKKQCLKDKYGDFKMVSYHTTEQEQAGMIEVVFNVLENKKRFKKSVANIFTGKYHCCWTTPVSMWSNFRLKHGRHVSVTANQIVYVVTFHKIKKSLSLLRQVRNNPENQPATPRIEDEEVDDDEEDEDEEDEDFRYPDDE